MKSSFLNDASIDMIDKKFSVSSRCERASERARKGEK